MNKLVFIIVASALPVMACAADKYTFSCTASHDTEYKFFKQAPHGAMRTGKHILEIKYSGGIRRFIDKPPYDETEDGLNIEGISWNYCGYSKIIKAHLISRREGSLYTGSLLFEDSGNVINGGVTVVFSPNKKNYLAIEQSAGADGQDWTLYDTSGHKHWKGFSTIDVPRKPTDTYSWEAATIENPSLSDDLKISAHMFCWQSGKKGNVTLKKNGGKWEWMPKIEC